MMLDTAAVDVVDLQEFDTVFLTAGTPAAIVLKHFPPDFLLIAFLTIRTPTARPSILLGRAFPTNHTQPGLGTSRLTNDLTRDRRSRNTPPANTTTTAGTRAIR